MTRYLVISTLAAAAVLALLLAQQPGGVDEIRARSAQDLVNQAAYASEPGGTPEDHAWEVLVLMGAGDTAPAEWNGTLSVTGGEVFQIHGYRTELPDRILPQGGWQIQTKIEKVLESSPIEGGGQSESTLLPKGVLVRGSGTEATRVEVRTKQGDCTFSPMRVAFGVPEKCLGGRIEVNRVPSTTDLSGTELRQHDFPAIGAGPEGTLWATWSSFHDRREELNLRRYQAGRWTRLIPVGRATEDLWRPQVVTDGAHKPWLIWSQQERGNWDIYAMPWEDNEWGARVRLSEEPTPDIEPHVARGADGAIYVVWQALSGRWSHIRMRYLKDGKWSDVLRVTGGENNNWEPAVAVGPNGTAQIAWDRYTDNYDVYTRSFSPAAGFSPERAVAATPQFEAHVSAAVDARNRAWIAYEASAANWGKDLGAALGDKAPGSPLGGPRTIHVEGAVPLQFSDALGTGSKSVSDPLLFVDPNDNLWLSFKRRYSRAAYRPSTYWETYLTRLDGDHWTRPIPLPDSWTRKSTRMGLAATGGRLWGFWPSESRQWAFASRPLANRVIAGSLPLPPKGAEPVHSTSSTPDKIPPAVEPGEAGDVSQIRRHRVTLGGQSLRIVRGDLHRHTELSQDVGGLDDGALPEFYRYMIDAADMDFGASTDHQAGGTDYWAFLTQKMADMYHFPQRFVPLYAYERNLGNPFGHRNIVHTKRDYPILPFFQRIDPRFMLPDSPDGELLTFTP